MSFLIDTNVISEFRKKRRADSNVIRWMESTLSSEHFTSVLVIGEIRRGIALKRRYDMEQAQVTERWLNDLINHYSGRILPIDQSVAETWGELGVPDPLPVIDSLLAATALVHGLVLVTRDEALLAVKEIRSVNPFNPN